jgi:hypothetical protein
VIACAEQLTIAKLPQAKYVATSISPGTPINETMVGDMRAMPFSPSNATP